MKGDALSGGAAHHQPASTLIERLEHCLRLGRSPSPGDLCRTIEALKRGNTPRSDQKSRKSERDSDLALLADIVCPGLTPRQAARSLRHTIEHERQNLPRPALECLERLDSAGLPRTDRQRANVLAVIRKRNKQEI